MGPTLLSLALLLSGCKGKDSDATPNPELACGEPSPLSMRRLTHDQYENTVWAAVELLGGESLALDLGPSLIPLLTTLPADSREDQLSREDQAVTQIHADGWYLVAERVADGAADPIHFGESFGSCGDASCVEGVVRNTIGRLHRRPLNPEEIAFYVDEVYGAAPDHETGLRDLVVVAMASPWFTHQIEHGDGVSDGAVVSLTAHELASRLSYHFWSAPPDDALWNAAEDGSLLQDEVYRAQVERIFADPRTDRELERFFTEWLELDELSPMHALVGDPRFEAFAAGFTPSAQLTDDLREDALGLIRWQLRHEGTLDALWTEDLNTAPSAEVAALYGSSVWDGASAPQPLGTGVHAGLLTRPAFTASGLASTRPIHKGVLIRKRILCDNLGSPPADMGPEPEIDPVSSTRERTEALTEIPGSSCYGCHEYINGLGFVTENFDGLGRPRTTEPIYAEDGTLLGEVPVETQAASQVELHDESVIRDGIELAAALAASPKPEACIARFWYRHTYGHLEDLEADRCTLESVSGALEANQPLASGLRAIALDPNFKLRKLDDSTGGAR